MPARGTADDGPAQPGGTLCTEGDCRMTDDYSLPRGSRLAERWGHFAPELLIVSILAVVAVGLHPLPAPFTYTAPIALLLFVLGSWLLMRRHDRGLCEVCVASMPLNPGEQATRYRRRFWLAHSGSEPRFLLPYMAVLIGSNLAPGPVGRGFWALMQCSMVYLIFAYSTHRRLQPWCPWCSEGGGGGEDHDDPVTPDPVPGDRRQLV